MAAIFAKYHVISAAEKLSVLNPITLISRLRGHAEKLPEKKSYAYLMRKIIADLGTTFIKFGQWMSVRPDFVPPEVLQELEQLQDRLPPIRFKIIKRTIERELGAPIDEIFAELDPFPLSTASIAQVHRGVLKTGEEVAVKVQHPNLRRLIAVDLSIISSMANWAVKNWPHLSLHRPDELISAFKETLMEETDFTVEAKHQSRVSQMFADTPWVRIPKVHWKYTTERLLVMEYLHGLKLTQLRRFPEWGLDAKQLSQRLGECMFRQIFESGFFHSDPHPGNILFMKDNQIGLIDFGIMGKLSDVHLDKLLDWFYAVIYRDIGLFVETFLEIGTPHAPIDKMQFRTDCMDYLDEMHFQPADRLSFAKVLAITNRILYRHKISTPPFFLFFFKAITTMEGVGRRLNPAYDWREDWGPKLRKIIQARYRPEAILKRYWQVLRDYDRLIASYPEDLREAMKKIKEGKFETEMHMPELRGYVSDIQKALHKLSVSLVVSAVIFGIFYLGRGQGDRFLQTFIGNFANYWWVILSLILIILYFRKR